jgi:hypothetical protein
VKLVKRKMAMSMAVGAAVEATGGHQGVGIGVGHVVEEVEERPETHADKTKLGRDWLEEKKMGKKEYGAYMKSAKQGYDQQEITKAEYDAKAEMVPTVAKFSFEQVAPPHALPQKGYSRIVKAVPNASGGTTATLPDRRTVSVSADGKTVTTSPDGTATETTTRTATQVDADGRTTSTTVHGDGSVAVTVADWAPVVQWTPLPQYDVMRLNGMLEELRLLRLKYLQCKPGWDADYQRRVKQAKAAVDGKLQAMKADLVEATANAVRTKDVGAAVACLVRGKRQLERARDELDRVRMPQEQLDANEELSRLCFSLRDLGDECDVDTRQLPVTWQLDLDWFTPPPPRATACFCCQRDVWEDELVEHMDAECSDTIGIAPKGQAARDAAAGGASMGGGTKVVCDITGETIDEEDTDLNAESTGVCPVRAVR